MKNTGTLIGVACCIIVIGLITTKSVFAGTRIEIHSGGIHLSHNYKRSYYGKNYGRGYKRHYNYGNHYSYGYRNKPYRHSYRYNSYRNHYDRPYIKYGGNYYKQAKSCHPVSKYTYDDYGDRHKIGGTMCYDRYGEGYVVEGSRYQIW